MVFEGIANFFNPDTTQKAKQQTQQAKQQFQQAKQQAQQGRQQFQQAKQQAQQGRQQAQQAQQQTNKQVQMPPLKETSGLFGQDKKQQQFKTSDQLSDAIIDQIKQQAQQSRQQLTQLKDQQASQQKIDQAKKAHEQLLGFARQAKTLLNQIKDMREINTASQQQDRQRLRQTKEQANEIVSGLRALFEQVAAHKKQTMSKQQTYIRQLKQLKQFKQSLLSQQTLGQKTNKKSIQYQTPDGNKLRIQVAIQPDSKCCVAQSLAQKAKVPRFASVAAPAF